MCLVTMDYGDSRPCFDIRHKGSKSFINGYALEHYFKGIKE